MCLALDNVRGSLFGLNANQVKAEMQKHVNVTNLNVMGYQGDCTARGACRLNQLFVSCCRPICWMFRSATALMTLIKPADAPSLQLRYAIIVLGMAELRY